MKRRNELSRLEGSSPAALEGLLGRHPLFSSLEVPLRRSLLRGSALVDLPPGETLYRAGEPATALFAVLRGALQIEYPEPGAQRGFVAAMLPAPAILGECQALHGRSWSGTGVSIFPVLALAISPVLLEQLMGSTPALGVALYRELSHRFLGVIDAWKLQQRRSPAQALVRYLVSFAETAALIGEDLSRGLPLRQSDLARAAGVRRETVNRTLSAWRRRGWVSLSRGRLSLLRPGELTHLLPEAHGRLLVQALDPAAVVPLSQVVPPRTSNSE